MTDFKVVWPQRVWNKVSLNVGADFQLIPSKDARKRTRNVHPCMQFYFIEKKTKKVS